MILLLTNRQDITADYVVCELKRRNLKYIRFNTEDFPENVLGNIKFRDKTLNGSLEFRDVSVPFQSIESIWFRRPVLSKISSIKIGKKYKDYISRESFWFLNGIWDNIDCFWISNPYSIQVAENKITQLHTAKELGFQIPKTLITNKYKEIIDFWDLCRREMIIKPIKDGRIDEKNFYTNKVGKDDIKALKKNKTVILPSIYQKHIQKKYDIRVTVIGKETFPVEIHSQNDVNTKTDWRTLENNTLIHKIHSLPDSIVQKCLKIVKYFNLEFGAIDMILAKNGEYYFLEINPNGQWAWIENRTGLKLTATLVNLLVRGKK